MVYFEIKIWFWCQSRCLVFLDNLFTVHSIKSTKKISNWTAVTVGSEYIRWLIIYNHAHCLLHTVMQLYMRKSLLTKRKPFSRQKKYILKMQSKSNKDKEILAPKESWSCFCHVSNFGTTCGFIFKRFKRFSNSADPSHWSATSAFLLQVAAHQLWCSHYKSLLINFSNESIKCSVSLLPAKWGMAAFVFATGTQAGIAGS